MSLYEVFPKDIEYERVSWWMRLKLRMFGDPMLRDMDGSVWGYMYKGCIYVIADPCDDHK